LGASKLPLTKEEKYKAALEEMKRKRAEALKKLQAAAPPNGASENEMLGKAGPMGRFFEGDSTQAKNESPKIPPNMGGKDFEGEANSEKKAKKPKTKEELMKILNSEDEYSSSDPSYSDSTKEEVEQVFELMEDDEDEKYVPFRRTL